MVKPREILPGESLLEDIFHELNRQHFATELPLPQLRWNARLSTSAGRFCPGSRHFLRPRAPLIEVASYLRDLPDGTMHVRDTILHEMIHYLLWHRQRPYGHTPEFNQILKKVGAKRYNTVPKERAWKHWYECPSCRHGFPTLRRLAPSACMRCCRQHNRGQFHERFRLVRMAPPARATSNHIKPPALGSAPEAANAYASEAVPKLSPAEIIRRLEELKQMVRPR